MNKRRLLKLADLLEADARKKNGIKFDIGVVGSVGIPDAETAPLDCGTTGCAMGLAAMSGAFERQGLGYSVSGYHVATTWCKRKVYYDTAARRLFDISQREANFLFSPADYDGPQRGAVGELYVAKRIRDFVAGKVSPAANTRADHG